MVIDIRGTQTRNKGAQLMLEAVAENLSRDFPLSVPPIWSDFEVRANLGARQTLHDYKHPRTARLAGNLIPSGVKRRYGLVADRDISGVVDASGYAYADAFGAWRSKREAILAREWRRRSVPVVLLPQAFGPFADKNVARWAREVINGASAVYVRDRTSLMHLESLGVDAQLTLAPDFTITLEPRRGVVATTSGAATIVPNEKMIATGAYSRNEYQGLLCAYASALASKGYETQVLVHETDDRGLSVAVAEMAGGLPVVEHADPRVLKAILAESQVVIASRFHAVVGALSSGVPTLALGWSHKYQELMRDFGVPDWCPARNSEPVGEVEKLLGDHSALLRMRSSKQDLAARVATMWSNVRDILKG